MASQTNNYTDINQYEGETEQEYQNIMVKVEIEEPKIENATVNENPPESEIKQEKIEQIKESVLPDNLNHSQESIDSLVLQLKQEIEESCSRTLTNTQMISESNTTENVNVKKESEEDNSIVSYDFPQFDGNSMNSSDGSALDTCLQEEVDMKCAKYYEQLQSSQEKSQEIKQETDFSVTETHLISNKLINTTSTITRPQDGIIESNTTNTLVMEITPMSLCSRNDMSKITSNPEEILPTQFHNQFEDSFQSNADDYILGDKEDSLLDTLNTKKSVSLIHCPQCTNMYKNTKSLRKHLEVHASIEKNRLSRISGMKKRREQYLKKHTLQKEAIKDNIELEQVDHSDTKCNEEFQLNSITGDVLPLEAYGLEDAKAAKKTPDKLLQEFRCTKCPKVYNIKASFRYHLRVHKNLDELSYNPGKTRKTETARSDKRTRKKVVDYTDGDEDDNKNDVKIDLGAIKAEGKDNEYQCACGKKFQRRSRMETCLRSHNLFLENSCYSCIACAKEFKNKDDLSLHRKRLHRKKFPCKFCPTDYNTRKELFKHLRLHQKVQLTDFKLMSQVIEGKKVLKCFICKKNCSEISELKSHVLDEHNPPYKCSHCKETFNKFVHFAAHTKTEHAKSKEKSVLEALEAFSELAQAWKCEDCNIQFNQADHLSKHRIEKHCETKSSHEAEIPQFKCKDCSRVFLTAKSLTSHSRVHNPDVSEEMPTTSEQGLLCIYCRKVCKDENVLTSHMRFHSSDRKYPCKYCDYRFATPEKRKDHAEIHTGNLRYVCFICEYRCSSEGRLKEHRKSAKHISMQEYLLTGKPIIEESDKTKSDKIEEALREAEWGGKKRRMSQASDSSNGSDVACEICGENFTSEKDMQEHKLTHPFIEFPNEDQPSRIFFK